jgi:alpha-1,3-rhamnosyl/mannosyltransferase
LHVLFDARVVQDHFPGIGRYAYGLLRALVEEGSVELTALWDPGAPDGRFGLVALAGRRLRLVAAPPVFSLRGQLALPARLRRTGARLFHAPYFVYPYLAPLPVVLTLHDLLPLRERAFLPGRRARLVYRLLTALAAYRARRVIADSDDAGREIAERLPGLAGRLRVVPLGADDFGRPDGRRENFLLWVGADRPHKNLDRLVAAYAAAGLESPLLLAGTARRGLPEGVRALGRVSDERLRDLYARAGLVVAPSLAEGFGLPVLEAMASGAPVLAADIAPFREVAGEAAVYFPPEDTGALAEGLARLAGDAALRARLAEAGRARAAEFSWGRAARETISVYAEALGR